MDIQTIAAAILIVAWVLVLMYAAFIFIRRGKKWPPHQKSCGLMSKKKANTFRILKPWRIL